MPFQKAAALLSYAIRSGAFPPPMSEFFPGTLLKGVSRVQTAPQTEESQSRQTARQCEGAQSQTSQSQHVSLGDSVFTP